MVEFRQVSLIYEYWFSSPNIGAEIFSVSGVYWSHVITTLVLKSPAFIKLLYLYSPPNISAEIFFPSGCVILHVITTLILQSPAFINLLYLYSAVGL